jgi:hypothetical protein
MPALAIADDTKRRSFRPIIVIDNGPPSVTVGRRMSDERCAWHLANWARWMHKRVGFFRRLWYPARASGGMAISGSSDFDAMADHADGRCARAVAAALDDLPQNQRLAIHCKHLHTVYRLRDLDSAYLEGCESIKKYLVRRGID